MEAEQVAVNPFLSTFSAALPAGTNRQLFLSCYQRCLKVEISLIDCGFLDNLQTLKNLAYHMHSESQVPREGLKRKFSVHTDFYFLLLTPPRWLQGCLLVFLDILSCVATLLREPWVADLSPCQVSLCPCQTSLAEHF